MSGSGAKLDERIRAWLARPARLERLVLLRVLAPLAILGFMSSRLVHADHWIGAAGFVVPDLGGDWRQPLYLPPLPEPWPWVVALTMLVSAGATIVGYRTRVAALVFAGTLAYVALADRLAAFTVSKISPAIALTIACSAAGARYALDARRDASSRARPTHTTGEPVRFLQLFLALFYCSSGFCKARGDWLTRWDVLWTHLHDSYQTPVSHFLANTLPASAWPLMQLTAFVFEIGAPLWFAWSRTRHAAFLYGLAMHGLIGMMFGPVVWFSLLMMTLLLVAYAPDRWVTVLPRPLARLEGRTPAASP